MRQNTSVDISSSSMGFLHKFTTPQCFPKNSSFLPILDKQVLDEHLLFLRWIRSESFDLILFTKAPFREPKTVFLRLNAHFVFHHLTIQCICKEAKNTIKYAKELKRHIYLVDFEWRVPIKRVNEYCKRVIDNHGCVEVVNDLLHKIVKALTKRIKIQDVSK